MAVFRIELPIENRGVLKEMRVGDTVYITGTVVTLRDLGHRRAVEMLKRGEKLPVDLRGLAVFHAGPIVRRVGEEWKIVSIGPTTSARMDIYVYDLVKLSGVALIVGKGGMGVNARRACREFGAVYVELVGGTAPLITKAIRGVEAVYWLDLGVPEAMWVLRVENLGPAIVTIDTEGRDLHEEVMSRAYEVVKSLV
ncbi:MAG TPA: hypothetical protein EYH02_05775 [Ignisphaera aggregans]|uniref:Fe-S hydro-lyase tartrate dehydratase beta-type catalytic domain-containing protein n=1 Tax=Ignisphaera aggregans TaxID=334771 RepID=A0A832YZ22_9CREN|nr:hypothetical protein [Ignisphaera aggregans]